MKKYIKPQIEVSNIEVESLLTNTSLSNSISYDSNDEIKDEKYILSKEYSFEDDWGYEE